MKATGDPTTMSVKEKLASIHKHDCVQVSFTCVFILQLDVGKLSFCSDFHSPTPSRFFQLPVSSAVNNGRRGKKVNFFISEVFPISRAVPHNELIRGNTL